MADIETTGPEIHLMLIAQHHDICPYRVGDQYVNDIGTYLITEITRTWYGQTINFHVMGKKIKVRTLNG